MGGLILAAVLACAEEAPVAPPETGFRVIGVVPDDGAADVIPDAIPELRFSEPTVETTCNADTVRLDGLAEDGSVAFPVDAALIVVDRGSKLQLDPDEALLPGWSYALTVQGGADGCTNAAGDPIEPFGARFWVP